MLKVEHIVKQYVNHTALNDVSFEVPEKSIFGLLGPNGAGKTTLIRIVNQITGPDSGRIFIDGQLLSPNTLLKSATCPKSVGCTKK